MGKDNTMHDITNIPTSTRGYSFEQSGIRFDRDLFIRRWHEHEEKQLLKMIGAVSFLMLLLVILS